MSTLTWHVVTGDFPPVFTGGVAHWTDGVARALSSAGERVVLYARGTHGAGRLGEVAHDARSPLYIRRIRGHRWTLRQGALVARALEPEVAPGDVVLGSTWPVVAGLVELCRKRHVRLGVGVQGSEITMLGGVTPAILHEIASVGRFLAVSRFLAQGCEERGIPAEVIPLPVVPMECRPPPGEGILTVSRLTPLKGVERVLRLGKALGWPVTVVGDGASRSELVELAERTGTDVRFTGRIRRAEVDEHYRRARLFALLSRPDPIGRGAEGLGLAVLEAAAHGVPSVVTSTGGLPEAVGPGLVLPCPDDPVHSAECVLRWLDADQGTRAWEFLRSRHGPQKTVAELRRLLIEGEA
jgi:glycosyltransferase involved in cell wall biosynthesis